MVTDNFYGLHRMHAERPAEDPEIAPAPMIALLCHRCDRPFKTTAIRTLCARCTANGALPTPECGGT